MHFIYVMREQDKDVLLERGFQLLKVNSNNNVWVFKNTDTEELTFSAFDFPHVLSDVLTF